ncbi:MAG: hypothetical protein ABSC60_05760 [Acidobacteriota bacterium]
MPSDVTIDLAHTPANVEESAGGIKEDGFCFVHSSFKLSGTTMGVGIGISISIPVPMPIRTPIASIRC